MKTLQTFSYLLICSLILFSFSACEKKSTAFSPAPGSAGNGPAGSLKSLIHKHGDGDYITDYSYDNNRLKDYHNYGVGNIRPNDTTYIDKNLLQFKNSNRLIERSYYGNYYAPTPATMLRYIYDGLGNLDSIEGKSLQYNWTFVFNFDYDMNGQLEFVHTHSTTDSGIFYSEMKINAFRNGNIIAYTHTIDSLSIDYEIAYDNHPNPFYQFVYGISFNTYFSMQELYFYFSENNATSVKITSTGKPTVTELDYTYVYNSKSLPSQIVSSTYGEKWELEYY